MLFKQIKIKNFRVFKGLKTFKFSEDKQKPFSIILGANASGKTSFCDAIIWCLRQDLLSTFKKNEIRNAYSVEDEQTYVEIEVEIKKTTYKIKRCLKNGKTKLVISKNGEKIKNPEIELNSICPTYIIDCFFVNGDGLMELPFYKDYKNTEKSDYIFDVLFGTKVKFKKNETALNSIFSTLQIKGIKIKIDSSLRKINFISNKSNENIRDKLPSSPKAVLDIYLITSLAILLAKETKFPIFYDSIFGRLGSIELHQLIPLFSNLNLQAIFLNFPLQFENDLLDTIEKKSKFKYLLQIKNDKYPQLRKVDGYKNVIIEWS